MFTPTREDNKMKVLITSQGRALDSQIDSRFGRAAYFALLDTETGQMNVVQNTQGQETAQGAGIVASEQAARLGAQAIVTGHCGPKAYRALASVGIPVYLCGAGTVKQAFEKFKDGVLTTAAGPDVAGHNA